MFNLMLENLFKKKMLENKIPRANNNIILLIIMQMKRYRKEENNYDGKLILQHGCVLDLQCLI